MLQKGYNILPASLWHLCSPFLQPEPHLIINWRAISYQIAARTFRSFRESLRLYFSYDWQQEIQGIYRRRVECCRHWIRLPTYSWQLFQGSVHGRLFFFFFLSWQHLLLLYWLQGVVWRSGSGPFPERGEKTKEGHSINGCRSQSHCCVVLLSLVPAEWIRSEYEVHEVWIKKKRINKFTF